MAALISALLCPLIEHHSDSILSGLMGNLSAKITTRFRWLLITSKTLFSQENLSDQECFIDFLINSSAISRFSIDVIEENITPVVRTLLFVRVNVNDLHFC